MKKEKLTDFFSFSIIASSNILSRQACSVMLSVLKRKYCKIVLFTKKGHLSFLFKGSFFFVFFFQTCKF